MPNLTVELALAGILSTVRCSRTESRLMSEFFRFNIQREGLEGTTWATDKIIKGQGKQVIRIPECIEDGQYLLRAEMIALHGARTPSGAQFYIHAPLFSPS